MLQFLIGVSTTVIFNVCGTLAVDLNPHRPSAVSAGSNLIRCTLSAAGLAVLQVVITNVGVGWCFTIFAAIAALTLPLLLMERHWGPTWRAQRGEKLGTTTDQGGSSEGNEETSNESKRD